MLITIGDIKQVPDAVRNPSKHWSRLLISKCQAENDSGWVLARGFPSLTKGGEIDAEQLRSLKGF